jgi:hypothetical protein
VHGGKIDAADSGRDREFGDETHEFAAQSLIAQPVTHKQVLDEDEPRQLLAWPQHRDAGEARGPSLVMPEDETRAFFLRYGRGDHGDIISEGRQRIAMVSMHRAEQLGNGVDMGLNGETGYMARRGGHARGLRLSSLPVAARGRLGRPA